MKHEFEQVKCRKRDVGIVKCKLCGKTITYNLRSIRARDELDNLICQLQDNYAM